VRTNTENGTRTTELPQAPIIWKITLSQPNDSAEKITINYAAMNILVTFFFTDTRR
jgi:hypothetical protein